MATLDFTKKSPKRKREIAIQKAIKDLTDEGKKVTFQAVSKRSGVAQTTCFNYLKLSGKGQAVTTLKPTNRHFIDIYEKGYNLHFEARSYIADRDNCTLFVMDEDGLTVTTKTFKRSGLTSTQLLENARIAKTGSNLDQALAHARKWLKENRSQEFEVSNV